jgi:hypothetical protein
MREIKAWGNAPSGRHGAQHAVDAHAHDQAVPERLDVDIGCAQLDRLFQEIVDAAHDGRPAREVAQVFDVVVAARERGVSRRFGGPGFGLAPLRQHRRDVLKRGDVERDGSAQHDLGRPHDGRVGRVGDGQAVAVFAGVIREHQGFAQKARGKPVGNRARGDQLRQRHPWQIVEECDLVGEIIGRELAHIPQVAKSPLPAARIRPIHARQELAGN